jgi:hypothetical protein
MMGREYVHGIAASHDAVGRVARSAPEYPIAKYQTLKPR